ncbi:E3 SUMO-protein ligase ZBED1-like [Lycorma delicatula]|uniref:E3 SUMO-protein ligase ZBED1-like n=1 Tax=Lycorma delicatula TaxID=130591 RepID=UPI003F5125D6
MTSLKSRLCGEAASKVNVHNAKGSNTQNKNDNQLLLSQLIEEKHTFVYKKLVVPMTMRSIYWKCYGFPASEDGEILTKVKIVCLLCKTVIAYNRNTSNLRMHLQNKHPQELQNLEMQAPPRKPRLDAKEKRALKKHNKSLPASYMYSTESDGTVEVEKHVQIVSDPNITLEEFNTPQSLRVVVKGDSPGQTNQNVAFLMQDDNSPSMDMQDQGAVDRKTISDAIAEFIITDLQLPDVVEAPGFQRLVATLRSPCEIPSKLRLVDDVIPKIYDTYRETVVVSLNSVVGDVTISIEEWESASSEIYITVSAHFLQQGLEDQLQSKVLLTYQCSQLSDTSQWRRMMDNLLLEWNLKAEKVKAVIIATEQAELISALALRGFTLIPCLIFTLQKVCMKGCFTLPVVSNVITKVRSLLALVYRYSNVLTTLRIQEHILQLEDVPLTSDYPKAWISTYIMLEQFLARRSIINSVIESIDPSSYEKDLVIITDDDWAVIEDVVTVLEPFKVTTMTLAEEKAPLVSLLKPLMWQLISVHLKVRENDSTLGKELKVILSKMLKERYSEKSVDMVLKAATTLDPRFKQLPYSVEEAKAMLNGPVKVLLTQMIEENGNITAENEGQTPSKKGRLSGMEFLLGDLCASSSALSISERAELEIAQYQSEPTANLDHCPLTWWQKAAAKFPNLARLASSYNCIPASATPPSRIPVESQIMFDMKRAKLGPEIVDKLLFLNSNHNM